MPLPSFTLGGRPMSLRPLQLLYLVTTCSRVSGFVHHPGLSIRHHRSSSSTGASRIINICRALSFSGDNQESPSEDLNNNRWDQLYSEGEVRRNQIEAMLNSDVSLGGGDLSQLSIASPPVRVITFDLDNTLWNTGATISAANDALAVFLSDNDIVQSKRTETIMGELFQAKKAKYCPLLALLGEDNATDEELEAATAPVLLTDLRKDALKVILMDDNGYSEEDAVEFADQAFQKWMDARYEAIPSHYSTNVVSVLEQIAALRDPASHQPILVGAITDGNSDPRNVPALKPFFDFCVNAEQVGVCKPDKRVYQTVMEIVSKHPNLQDMAPKDGLELDDWIGPWWIHIGDDFSKDIVAAKNLNIRTVWARELILDKLAKEKEDNDKTIDTPAVIKNMSPEKELMEFQKKINSQTVVQMAVGAEDYLISSIQQEFADSIIDDFGDLIGVVREWQQRSEVKQPTTEASSEEGSIVTSEDVEAATTAVAVSVPESMGDGEELETKFCMFCGTKTPKVALFCPSCSKKQPEMSS